MATSSRASSTAPTVSESSASSDQLYRRANSWQPVTPPRSGAGVARPASASDYSSVKRPRPADACEEEEARRVKMYSKRDGAKLMKEYEHARDPTLVEVAPEQRCTRCMRNQWRCFIEADPNSPRRVCRPCGKNKCSFGNAKARPDVIPDYPQRCPNPAYPKQEPSEHHRESSPVPYQSPAMWQSYRLQPGPSVVAPGSVLQREAEYRPYPNAPLRPSDRSHGHDLVHGHGHSHRYNDSQLQSRQYQQRPQSMSHSGTMSHSQSPPPMVVESPPSPSAHIYRRGSNCTQSSGTSPRTPPQEAPQDWSRGRLQPPLDASGMRGYKAQSPMSRDLSLATIRDLMATTRMMMGRLAELEAQIERQQ